MNQSAIDRSGTQVAFVSNRGTFGSTPARYALYHAGARDATARPTPPGRGVSCSTGSATTS